MDSMDGISQPACGSVPSGCPHTLENQNIFPKMRLGFLTIACGIQSIPRMATKKIAPVKDRLSKTQIIDLIAGETALTRKQVAAVLDSLGDVIEAHVKKNAVGEFVLPGILKINTVRKPAVKARKGINPFTKEEVMFKAKPATTAVKVRALKKLKDMVL
jgi:nucleoid DNA-binding protein